MTLSFFQIKNVDRKITKFHIRQKSENKTSDLDLKHFRVCSILEKTDIQIFEIFATLIFLDCEIFKMSLFSQHELFKNLKIQD